VGGSGLAASPREPAAVALDPAHQQPASEHTRWCCGRLTSRTQGVRVPGSGSSGSARRLTKWRKPEWGKAPVELVSVQPQRVSCWSGSECLYTWRFYRGRLAWQQSAQVSVHRCGAPGLWFLLITHRQCLCSSRQCRTGQDRAEHGRAGPKVVGSCLCSPAPGGERGASSAVSPRGLDASRASCPWVALAGEHVVTITEFQTSLLVQVRTRSRVPV
jgi:hypothetical protein